ncbi:MAG: radical SAM protein [Candidatus Methanoliparum thermophilum]|uniref:Radical SAM protein n=2 Tax=Candidatus Methanoliparum TaxID=2545692 RepID=A0A520KSQ2_METT2|nr:MAG: radical SAM protein [Candidatus Methanoliparum thermophilum]
MYCRFCTRKRKVGRIDEIPMKDIMRAVDYIKEHKEVRDVLISGGDPFMRSNRDLDEILGAVRSIEHVEIIRIGTRIPVTLPSRITPKLVDMLKKYHPLYINIHFEHPREIDEECSRALALFADAGIPLGSQSVLLRGLNDDPVILKELFQKDENLEKKIKKDCCKGLCRIDIRLDDNGSPNVLDVNPLLGLAPDPKENSRFPRACYVAGMEYRDIIGRILFLAIERYKIKVRV